MKPLELVRDLLARIVAVGEALDAGDTEEARAMIGALECDIAGALRNPDGRTVW